MEPPIYLYVHMYIYMCKQWLLNTTLYSESIYLLNLKGWYPFNLNGPSPGWPHHYGGCAGGASPVAAAGAGSPKRGGRCAMGKAGMTCYWWSSIHDISWIILIQWIYIYIYIMIWWWICEILWMDLYILIGFLISMIGIYDDFCVSLEGFPWQGWRTINHPFEGHRSENVVL